MVGLCSEREDFVVLAEGRDRSSCQVPQGKSPLAARSQYPKVSLLAMPLQIIGAAIGVTRHPSIEARVS